MSQEGSKNTCVTFCEGCPFANGASGASVDSLKMWSAYGDEWDSEGKYSMAFSDGVTTTKAVYADGSIHGTFGSESGGIAKEAVVEHIQACEEPVAIRGLFRTRQKCGAFFNKDGNTRTRIIEIRNKVGK